MRICAQLDTGPGPSVVKRSQLPITNFHMRTCNTPLVSDFNGHALKIVGTTPLFVLFVTYVFKCYFYVFESLVTSYVLVVDFCDKLINPIMQMERIVKLYDGNQIPIIRRRPKSG